MRKYVLRLLATAVLSGTGYGVYNYTGTDIVLPNGETLITHDLTRSLTKDYKTRSLEDSLYITIHHTAGSKTQSVEAIADFHVNHRGWPEIAYHSAIDEDGNVYLLNFFDEISYHDSGENTKSIGIVLIGNYETEQLSDDTLESLKIVLNVICQELKIKGIRGHKDTSPTLCPGANAHNILKQEGILFQ